MAQAPSTQIDPITVPRRKPFEIRYSTESYPNALWDTFYDYEAAKAELLRLNTMINHSPHAEARRGIRNATIA